MTRRRGRMKINPPVYFTSLGFILLFIVFGAVLPERAEALFSAAQAWVGETFGWFYLLTVAVFLIFSIGLALSSYGRIKLGPDHSEPEFSYRAWFAMLFSAGMGIGLMFFGVAEPILHFMAPPDHAPGSLEAARAALQISFFHWGLHAWAIYAVVALSLAYFSFRHGLPLTIRSAFYPLLGERIHGPIGHAVDIFAVLGTIFGVATSLGFGVMQINAGLHHLLGVPLHVGTQLLLILGITAIATLSVAAGLDRGIRRLSEFNVGAAIVLLLFVLVSGPTVFLLQALVQNTGGYLADLVHRTFNLYAYRGLGWITDWTIFYWAWWIAWSPFVGMFIARISRGRTIREFVGGVLLVPTGFGFMWFTFFGNTGIDLILSQGVDELGLAVQENVPLALFLFLEQFPWAGVTSLLATLLVITFFVTSSDSGALVIDILTSGGAQRTPAWQRIFWAVAAGAVAGVLLLAGGLDALQAAAITGALPLAFILLLACWGLLKALRIDAVKRVGLQTYMSGVAAHPRQSWQQRVKHMLSFPHREEAERFLVELATPALEAVAEEFRQRGLEGAEVSRVRHGATLTLPHGEQQDFLYAIRLRCYTVPDFAWPEFEFRDPEEDAQTYYRAEVFLREGSQDYDLLGLTREQLIADVLAQYERHLHFLHLARPR